MPEKAFQMTVSIPLFTHRTGSDQRPTQIGRLEVVALAEDVDAYIRRSAITVHHPAGTCRMGSAEDARSVVGADLKVHGVDGLRVVDASVMPDLPNGNINAAVLMIAERAADFIKSQP